MKRTREWSTNKTCSTMPFTFRSTVVIQTVLVDRFLDGEMFLIFRGTQYPQGEMRGQLRRVHKFFAVRPRDSRAHATRPRCIVMPSSACGWPGALAADICTQVMNPGSVVPQLDLTDSTLSSGGIFLANYTRHNDPNDVKGLPEKTLSVNVDHDLFGNPTDAAIWEGDVGKVRRRHCCGRSVVVVGCSLALFCVESVVLRLCQAR